MMSLQDQTTFIKAAILLRTVCMMAVNVVLDILLLHVAAKYNVNCPTLPFHFIELLIAVGSIGIISCFIEIICALCIMLKPEKTVSFLFCLSQLKVCFSMTRNVLLMLAAIPLYYIKLKPNEERCSDWYKWVFWKLSLFRLLFYVLSIIIKSGAQIFRSQTTE